MKVEDGEMAVGVEAWCQIVSGVVFGQALLS